MPLTSHRSYRQPLVALSGCWACGKRLPEIAEEAKEEQFKSSLLFSSPPSSLFSLSYPWRDYIEIFFFEASIAFKLLMPPDIKLYWRWVCTPGGAIRQHKRSSCVGLSPLCHRIRETIDVAITSDPIIRVHRIRSYACSPHLMHNDIYYCALCTCIKREQSTSNCLRSFFFSLAAFLCRSDMFI